MEQYKIYALVNKKHNKIYIGQTKDIENRLQLHRNKTFKGYTSRFDGEWELFYSEDAKDRKEALIREKQLKSYRGRQFLKNILI